jgi:hypothetical protein
MNRMESQAKRGGSSLCFRSSRLHSLLSPVLLHTAAADCPNDVLSVRPVYADDYDDDDGNNNNNNNNNENGGAENGPIVIGSSLLLLILSISSLLFFVF